MKQRVIIVGGVSRGGKSTLAVELAEAMRWRRFECDAIYLAMSAELAPWDADEAIAKKVMQSIVTPIVHGLIDAGASCIIDGWVVPADVIRLRTSWPNVEIDAVYLGYPEADPADLYLIHQAKPHWLSKKDRSFQLKYFADQIEGSKWYRCECDRLRMPFVDTACDFDQKIERTRDMIVSGLALTPPA